MSYQTQYFSPERRRKFKVIPNLVSNKGANLNELILIGDFGGDTFTAGGYQCDEIKMFGGDVGTKFPSGIGTDEWEDWFLCNGQVTPNGPTLDLRHKFVTGYDPDPTFPEYNTIGQTGGEDSVTLTAEQSGLPEHDHPFAGGTIDLGDITIPLPEHTHTINAHDHGLSGLSVTLPEHTHNIEPHKHDIEAHDHLMLSGPGGITGTISIPDHDHDISPNPHTHCTYPTPDAATENTLQVPPSQPDDWGDPQQATCINLCEELPSPNCSEADLTIADHVFATIDVEFGGGMPMATQPNTDALETELNIDPLITEDGGGGIFGITPGNTDFNTAPLITNLGGGGEVTVTIGEVPLAGGSTGDAGPTDSEIPHENRPEFIVIAFVQYKGSCPIT